MNHDFGDFCPKQCHSSHPACFLVSKQHYYPSHIDPPAKGQAVIFLTALLEVAIYEFWVWQPPKNCQSKNIFLLNVKMISILLNPREKWVSMFYQMIEWWPHLICSSLKQHKSLGLNLNFSNISELCFCEQYMNGNQWTLIVSSLVRKIIRV